MQSSECGMWSVRKEIAEFGLRNVRKEQFNYIFQC